MKNTRKSNFSNLVNVFSVRARAILLDIFCFDEKQIVFLFFPRNFSFTIEFWLKQIPNVANGVFRWRKAGDSSVISTDEFGQ